MWKLLLPHLPFETTTLFLSAATFSKVLFLIVPVLHNRRNPGAGWWWMVGGLFLHLGVCRSAYIFSLGSFQRLPLSSSRFHAHPGHLLLAAASLQLPDGPRLAPDVQAEFHICSGAERRSRKPRPRHRKAN